MEYLYILLLKYRYVILFPLAIPLGPEINIIASFLASLGYLNIYIVYIIIVAGDVIGDSLWYWVARLGREHVVEKYGSRFGITSGRIFTAERHLHNHFYKTMIIGKVTNIVMLPIIIACGILRINYRKFIITAFSIDLCKDLIFTLIGYYFGVYYKTISTQINTFSRDATLFVLFVVAVYFGVKHLRTVLYERYEK